MKFLRLLAWGHRWRKRAIKAETRLIEVSAQAEAERWRNVMREDMFASAAAFGGRGMVGISPRTGPAPLPERNRLIEAPDPTTALTGIERMEFQTQWLPAGRERGFSETRIMRDFLAELATRKSFNDEPAM